MRLEADVVVVGLGPTGFAAAIAAARKGKKVLALESKDKIGGVMTRCPGMPWGAGYPLDKPIGGIFTELAESMLSAEPPMARKIYSSLANFGPEVVYDHNIAINKMYDMLEEAGVDFRLNAVVYDVTMNGNNIDHIKYYDMLGQHEAYGKMFVDGSGDGIIASAAGVPFQKGNEKGLMMGGTLTFIMKNCDTDKIFSFDDPYYEEFATKGVLDGELPEDMKKLYLMPAFRDGEVYFNNVNVQGVDGTDPFSVQKATREGVKKAETVIKWLKKGGIPGFEDAHMYHMGAEVGVRETRKFEGMYQLTIDELRNAPRYEDGIVCCDNPIDDVAREDDVMTHEAVVEQGKYYHIPFRVCVPKRVENLFFGGRNLSVDTYSFATVRGMPQCFAMGQAAGTAAVQCIDAAVPVQEFNTESLVKDLQKQGVNGIGEEEL